MELSQIEKEFGLEKLDYKPNIIGWSVLFTCATISTLYNEKVLGSPVYKFKSSRWLGEFLLTWCFSNVGIVILVDESCPDIYKIDSSEIETVIWELINNIISDKTTITSFPFCDKIPDVSITTTASAATTAVGPSWYTSYI